MLHLVLGGARSGKSSYAEQILWEKESVLYVATATRSDESMEHRIQKHIERRPVSWDTLEKFKDFTKDDFKNYKYILVDCLTLMINNCMFDNFVEIEKLTEQEKDELEKNIEKEVVGLLESLKGNHAVLVSNEVGLGLASPYASGNYFRDVVGRMNQRVAKQANRVSFLVSGIPMVIKDE